MNDYEISIKSGSSGAFCNISERRTRTVTYTLDDGTATSEVQPFGDHRDSVSLADYAIREMDDEIAAADALVAAGKMRPEERPAFPKVEVRAIIGYREDEYRAALLDKITPLIGKDASDLLAGVALESAKVEAARADLESQRAAFATEAATAAAAVQSAQADLAKREAQLAADRTAVEAARAEVQNQAAQVLDASRAMVAAHEALSAAIPAALDG